MDIRIEFAGGTELLFDKAKFLEIKLEENGQVWTIAKLIELLSTKYIKERVELFSTGDKIRPGILVLINDVDFEILGGYEYVLKEGDRVLFISTLHGG